jgi:Na+/H+-dicarboxylate symporter
MTNVWGDLACAAMVDHLSKKRNATKYMNEMESAKAPFSQAKAAKLLAQYPKDL